MSAYRSLRPKSSYQGNVMGVARKLRVGSSNGPRSMADGVGPLIS